MRQIQGAVSLALLALWLVACAQRAEDTILGEWILANHIAPETGGNVSGQADGWRGSRAFFSDRRSTILKNECDAPAYLSRTITRAAFEAEHGVSPSKLGIPGGDVRAVHLSCKLMWWRVPGNPLYVVSSDKLLFEWDGVFFLLTRE